MKIYSATINNSSPGIIIIPSHIEKLNLDVNEMIRFSFVISLLDFRYNSNPLLKDPINSNLKLSNIKEFNENFLIGLTQYQLQKEGPNFILQLCYYILLLFTYLIKNDREILMKEVILKPFYNILITDLNICDTEKELILEFIFKCQKNINTIDQAYLINLYYDDTIQAYYMKILNNVFYNGEKNDYLVDQRVFMKARIDKYQMLFNVSVQNFLLKNFDENIKNTIKKIKNKQEIDINERIEIMLYPILKEVQQNITRSKL